MAKGKIVNPEESNKYLKAYKDGKIPMGLKIGCGLDDYLRFKSGSFNVFLGHANVGKTAMVFYYMLLIAIKHNKRFAVFSSENTIGSIKRDLVQFLEQKKITELEDSSFYNSLNKIDYHFGFFDIDHIYSHRELLSAFNEYLDYDGYLIDPYNSLIKDESIKLNTHEYDYMAASEIRIFCRKHNKTVNLIAHAATEALRKQYKKGHEYEGYPMPPTAADIEGGGKWVNRCDDFITIHRLTQHPNRWMFTEIHVRKIKDTDSGGRPTYMDEPVCFRMHNAVRFFCQESYNQEKDPLNDMPAPVSKIEANSEFDNQEKYEDPF